MAQRAKSRTVYPLDEVRAAWKNGEFAQHEMVARLDKSPSTVCRVLNGKVDPGHEGAKRYYEALLAIRAERAATTPKKEGTK